MTRTASPNDFALEIEGIGRFIFGRRTGRDRFRISAEFHRLTEGLPLGDSDLAIAAEAFATVKTLLVEGPKEITDMLDLDAPASTDPDADSKLLRVFFTLRQKELSFRPGTREGSETARQGDVGDGGVLVSEEVQPGAA